MFAVLDRNWTFQENYSNYSTIGKGWEYEMEDGCTWEILPVPLGS